MFFVEPFAVPSLDDVGAIDALLETALDADRPQPARVSAFHRLRGVVGARRDDVARALVAVLNEHTSWLGSEALLCIRELAPSTMLGVRSGFFVASTTAAEDLIEDRDGALHCPTLGPVAGLVDVGSLADVPALPWLVRRPAHLVLFVDGVRTIAMNGELEVKDATGAARIITRGGDVLVSALAGDVRLDGERLVAPVSTKRLLPRARLMCGQREVRLVRFAHQKTLMRNGLIFLVAGAPTWVAIGDAHAIPGGGHVAVLGAQEIALVVAEGAERAPCPPWVADVTLAAIGTVTLRLERLHIAVERRA